MPIQFDSKGNPIKYASMKPEDIAKAGTSIKDLLTSIGNAVVTTIEGNEKIFGDKNLFFGTRITACILLFKKSSNCYYRNNKTNCGNG